MKRGEIWAASRAGNKRLVVIIGHDSLTAQRDGVLVVPLSQVRASTIIEPTVFDQDGQSAGIAMVPRAGEIDKGYFVGKRGALSPESLEVLEVALRAVFDM